jgi:asparagine synthase (glutamine-hydrolysing)
MCGIAGIIGTEAARHRDVVRRMTTALRHRGPDGDGIYVSPSGRCVLGHSRLAILDLSKAASQPITTADDRFALSYNGECYNFRELRESLRRDGQKVTSSGDTEVVLRTLVSRGAAMLPDVNGMFALAFWDDREGSLLLARDQFGQKPLYYAESNGLLLFASEVRALLESGLVARRADRDAVVGFLSFGSVQEPTTIVEGVSALAPGTSLTARPDGQRESNCYWTPPREKRDCPPSELKHAFASSVSRHLLSDAPIGVFLSGGIDSSAIAVAAARVSSGTVKTVSVVCPDAPDLSEQKFARLVAEREGTEHCEVPFSASDQAELIPDAIAAMDQPTVDGVNTYVVSAAARQAGLKVSLSGLGGDELFGGYRGSFVNTLTMLRASKRLGALRRPASVALRRFGTFATRPSKLADMFSSPGDLVSAYLVRRKLFTSAQVRSMFPGLVGSGWCDGLPAGQFASMRRMVQSRADADAIGLLEMRRYMGQQLLRDSDAMGMAHGLEIRMPFLDTGFSASALMLDASARVPSSTPKQRFVQCLGDWLPSEIARRRKQGFLLPIQQSMLGPMRAQVDDGLGRMERFGSLVDMDVVRRQWDEFCRRPQKLGWTRPWSLFVLERYLAHWNLELEPGEV